MKKKKSKASTEVNRIFFFKKKNSTEILSHLPFCSSVKIMYQKAPAVKFLLTSMFIVTYFPQQSHTNNCNQPKASSEKHVGTNFFDGE